MNRSTLQEQIGVAISKAISVTLLLTITSGAYAQQTPLDLMLDSVQKHAQLKEKNHLIKSKQLMIKKIQADNGIKINFSTNSNAPIKSNINVNSARINPPARGYIDGVFTATTSLYDFGKVEASVNAEKQQEQLAKLNYEQAFESVLYRLADLVLNYQKMDLTEQSLSESKLKASKAIELLELQYKSGVGTISEVREIQISRLDIETSRYGLNLKKQGILKALKQEFGINKQQISVLYKFLSKVNASIGQSSRSLLSELKTGEDIKVSIPRSEKMTATIIKAINYQIDSIKAADKPQISAQLSAIAYDLTNQTNEYNIFAGISIDLPLFDSGSSSVKIESAAHDIQIEKDKLKNVYVERQFKLDELTTKTRGLKINYRTLKEKHKQLAEKLSHAKLRLKQLDGSVVTQIKVQLQLDEVTRGINNYTQAIMQANLDYLQTNENLLNAVGIELVIKEAN